MKPRHLLLGAALAGTALLAAFGERPPAGEIAEAVQRAPAPRARAGAPVAASAASAHAASFPADEPRILALIPREALIGDADDQFRQDGDPVFARQDWTPPPPPPAPAAPAPPPPPSAPPLPFTFIGKSVAGGAWEVYLARGDRTYVVRDKTVIDGTYRVETIAPPLLVLTYLPLNQVQQLNIGVFD